ncbi:unnamed protein product, partial [Soboliphyme baturini]|uniref:MFS domain-containing protein n=1 Tax=Soboliphyme baturini TaxID=241478 RepID=A0A183J3R7_9BILA
ESDEELVEGVERRSLLLNGRHQRGTKCLLLLQKCVCCRCSKRWQLAWLASVGFLIVFGIRCNFGAAKVRMTQNYTDSHGEHTAPFRWSAAQLGLIESSFFYGYLVTQLPGGFIANRFPATRLFGFAVGITSLLNLLMPVACESAIGLVVLIQILQGLTQGVAYPAVHGIWRFWAPPMERTKLATTTFTGSYAGAVVGLPLSALLTSYCGWSMPFYVYGICGGIWFIFWYVLIFETPAKHPTITMQERAHIENAIGRTSSKPVKFSNVPWKEIFKSKCVWAILVANFCRSWTFYLLLISQLSYMKEVLSMEIEHVRHLVESGLLASLPHIAMSIVVLAGGQLADSLRSHKLLSTTAVRKLFNCGGFGMEAVFLICCAYVRNPVAAVTCLILAVGFSGFAISGFNVNHLDIAPRYASILMGMSNGIGTFAGMICPMITERLTTTYYNYGWTTVLLLAGLIHLTGITFYAIFASGEQQPWAEPSGEEDETWDRSKMEQNGDLALSSYGTIEPVHIAALPTAEQLRSRALQRSEGDPRGIGTSIDESQPHDIDHWLLASSDMQHDDFYEYY